MTSPKVDAGDGLPLTIPAVIRRHAAERPDDILLAVDETRLSYGEADARSQKLARGLIAAGAGKGDHVALLFPNGADYMVAMLAAARIGAVALPFSTLSTADELRGLLVRSDSAFVLSARGFRSHDYGEKLAAAFPELDFSKPPPLASPVAPWLRHIGFRGGAPAGWDPAWSIEALEDRADQVDEALLEAAEARVSPADRFAIIHTSGSTSLPKGVMHSHGTLIRHVNNINEIRSFGADDVLFSTAPWFWVAGFAFGMLATLVAGAEIVYSNSTVASDVLDLIERERPTLTNGYPPTVAWLAADPSYAERDFSWLRRGNLYGILAPDARPPDPTLRHDLYGMSETGSALAMSSDESDLPERLRGSCGKFVPGFEGKIVDPETGKECGPGEIGELWVRGSLIMEGYYGRPRSEIFDLDGWWRSGDMGMLDGEGFYYLMGRLGGMIKSAGANVSPREVEAVLSDLTGGLQCMVLGVPDPERGQAVAGVVVAESDEGFDEKALREQIAGKLSSYKVPRRILRLRQDEVPTVSSGKVDSKKLAEVVQARW